MDYLKDFIDLLGDKAKDKEITEATELKTLGVDSIDLVEIIMEVESKYEITFNNEELSSFVTVGDFIKAIKTKR